MSNRIEEIGFTHLCYSLDHFIWSAAKTPHYLFRTAIQEDNDIVTPLAPLFWNVQQ